MADVNPTRIELLDKIDDLEAALMEIREIAAATNYGNSEYYKIAKIADEALEEVGNRE